MQENDESKKVILEPIEKSQKKSEKVIKEKSKRVITKSNKWNFSENDLQIENQQLFLQQVLKNENENENKKNINKNTKILCQQINKKIYGYKTQDIEKSLYMPTEFVDFNFVVNKLNSSPKCYYCKEPVQLIYEFVREPKQWTLERIDNKLGHIKTNVVIACLNCNLHRKTMHTERYLFTKQLNIVKSEESI